MLALQLAAWARYLEGVDENGQAIPLIEKRLAELRPLALAHRDDSRAFFEGNSVLGDLARNERLIEAFAAASRTLREKGALGAIEELISNGGVPG